MAYCAGLKRRCSALPNETKKKEAMKRSLTELWEREFTRIELCYHRPNSFPMARLFLIAALFLFSAISYAEGKREMPDYSGVPTQEKDEWLVIPRVIFFPAYVVTEYGYRQPLRWLGRKAELNNLPYLVSDFFKFGEEKQFALYPSVLIDFGFLASFGLRFRWNNFLTQNNKLSLRGATGGTNYGILRIADDWAVEQKQTFHFAAEISRRPDFIYHDMGPMASKDDRFRYGAIKKSVEAGFSDRDFVGGTLTFENVMKDIAFRDGDCCNEPGIDAGILAGRFATPSRYPSGYTALSQKLAYNLGGRVSRPKQRAGGIVDAHLQHSFDFAGGGWWIYGGALTAYYDLTGHSRVIALKVETELSAPHGGTRVPFDELPSLGGDRLPGFLSRRFIDESVFALTLGYKWPVLSLFDGVLHCSLGNVFKRDLAGLQWGWLRKSIGIGIEPTGDDGPPFGFLLAFGSQPFDLGGDFNEFRFSLSIGGI